MISAAIGFFTSTGVLDEVDAVFTAKESVCLFHFLIVFHVDQDAVRATLSVSGQPQARASETTGKPRSGQIYWRFYWR